MSREYVTWTEQGQPVVLWLGVEPDDAEFGDRWESEDGLMVYGPDGWETA